MEQLVNDVLDTLNKNYWKPIRFVLENNKQLRNTIMSFLINPEKIHIYLGKDHLAVEYFGSYSTFLKAQGNIKIACFDYQDSDNFIESITGIEFGKGPIRVPLSGEIDDLFVATPEATEILAENNWNFLSQEMMFMTNISGISLQNGFSRFRNSFFYEKNGDGLKVRNIKWLDVFPIDRIDVDENIEEIIVQFPDFVKSGLVWADAHYTIPEKFNYQYEKLIILNRFIEIYNSEGINETEITRFLAEPENQFILKMAFFGNSIHTEKECKWVNYPDRSAIRPDYFVSSTNGYSDIVEFKLPKIKSESAVVGRENRETFSSEINSYISQTRVYKEYFEDPRNRKHVKETYGIDVYYPKRFLVIGRRWMLGQENWRAIQNDFQGLTILTYDDIVDTVMGHLMS
ncbi:Shedu anti-phage system protein SduA domain-containing protein [Metabacillus indicus]|uniref:Shedu anti-phage system protein SduA domain-containing protein n=1 Tax=Metabacillus indicus TaxID=246786 RepID=UPI003CFA2AFA